ncbi:unnamed protein product [Ixodes pacificus]
MQHHRAPLEGVQSKENLLREVLHRGIRNPTDYIVRNLWNSPKILRKSKCLLASRGVWLSVQLHWTSCSCYMFKHGSAWPCTLEDVSREGCRRKKHHRESTGLGIFVCHVLMNKKTRDAIKRSIMNTGSMVKGSISSRSSRSGTSSSRTTWYPFTRSSTSSRAAPAPENPSPNNSKSQSSSSDTDTDANPCPELECWPGARFKYDLKLGDYQGDKIAPDIPLDKSALPRFRPSRQSEA